MIPRFIKQALSGEKITIHGDGSQSRDWLHTYDLARALDLVLHIEDFSKVRHQVIHIGTGISTSVMDIARLILAELELAPNHMVHTIDRPGQVQCHISSTSKAKELLGWEPTIPLDKGLMQVIRWYIANRDWAKTTYNDIIPENIYAELQHRY